MILPQRFCQLCRAAVPDDFALTIALMVVYQVVGNSSEFVIFIDRNKNPATAAATHWVIV